MTTEVFVIGPLDWVENKNPGGQTWVWSDDFKSWIRNNLVGGDSKLAVLSVGEDKPPLEYPSVPEPPLHD